MEQVLAYLENFKAYLGALFSRSRKTRIEMIFVGSEEDIGQVKFPEYGTLIYIENQGTHGVLDTCVINQQWNISGGTYRILNFAWNERDTTDWSITFTDAVVERAVLFIFKVPC